MLYDVSRLMTLIEFKGAIYRGLGTNLLRISSNSHNEYDIYQGLPVFISYIKQRYNLVRHVDFSLLNSNFSCY